MASCDDDSNAPSNQEDDSGFSRSDGAVTAGDGDGDGSSGRDSGSRPPPGRDASVARDAASPLPEAGPGPGPGTSRDASTPDAATNPPTKGTPVFVAVGYAGRRVRSTDLGLTWTDDTTLGGGGDDQYLLRAVTFGKGVFVATGWKILTSPDGRAGTWTDHTMPSQQWLGGVQFGNNRFVATGGYGFSANSTDGLSWSPAGSLQTQASRSLAFGEGKFVSATDAGNWWSSTDGESWTTMSGGHQTQVAYCGGFKDESACSGKFTARNQAVGEGIVIRAVNGDLQRSTNGTSFTTVLSQGQALEAVAFGYVE
jgi:hypothetical protein